MFFQDPANAEANAVVSLIKNRNLTLSATATRISKTRSVVSSATVLPSLALWSRPVESSRKPGLWSDRWCARQPSRCTHLGRVNDDQGSSLHQTLASFVTVQPISKIQSMTSSATVL